MKKNEPIFTYIKKISIKSEILLKKLQIILSTLIPLFLIINYNFYPFSEIFSRVFILCSFLIIIFISKPLNIKQTNARFIDYILILLSIGIAIFAYFEIDKIIAQCGFNMSNIQIIFSALSVIIVFEATRRVVGPLLPLMALILICYTLYEKFPIPRIITEIFSYDGIFGFVLSLALSVVFIFIILGSLLNEANFGPILLKFGESLLGGTSGGPAKVAVFSSALFGSISGSAVANVVGTGTFTIPMMKELGFKPHVAAAVEASASTGGQIMPPVMAAVAFVMAEILQVPYLSVMKSAFLPAIAYYVCIYVGVDAYSKNKNLKGIPKQERPALWETTKEGIHLFLIPIIITVLLIRRIDPIRAAFLSALLLIPISFLKKSSQLTPKKILKALMDSVNNAQVVIVSCATVGIVIACIALTGVGGKIASNIVSLGGDNILLMLLLSMATCILFGMALPTTASYLICIAVIGPALISIGILPMGAHFFVFYCSTLSAITPPVATAVFAAAGIAGADIMKTALTAIKLSIVAFVLPYMFIYAPSIILMGNNPPIFFSIAIYIIILPFSFAWGIHGQSIFKKINTLERTFYIIISVLIIYFTIKKLFLMILPVAMIWSIVFLYGFFLNRKEKQNTKYFRNK